MTTETKKDKWPETEDELLAYMRENIKPWSIYDYKNSTQEEKDQAYEDSANSMWKAALAAFQYAAGIVGASGFQAGWAALKFYGEAMTVDCPYAVITAEELLYPQYDLRAKVEKYIHEWTEDWAREEARKKIAEINPKYPPHPAVVKHWRDLAEGL